MSDEQKSQDWYASSRDDDFTGASGPYSTREAAVAAGSEVDGELGLEPGDTFHVGRAELWRDYYVSGRRVVEHAQDQAADDLGEHSDGWLDNVPGDQLDDLTERLTAVFDAWLTETGNQPGFFRVNEISEHEVGEKAEVKQEAHD